MVTTPAVTPVTMPELETVAMPVLLLAHEGVGPEVAVGLAKAIVWPTQTADGPVTAPRELHAGVIVTVPLPLRVPAVFVTLDA